MTSTRKDPPPRANWARALACAPSAKFRATADVYRHVGFGGRGGLNAVVEANVEFTYQYYCRLPRLRWTATRAALLETVQPDCIERLTDAVSRRRGVILASAHVGDFDVAGLWLSQAMGLEVVVVSDPVAERPRQAFFDGIRRASGLILRRRERTRLADLERDLRAGRVVLWMLDRAARGPAVQGRWLGRSALLPVAPYVLARRTGCSLIAGVTTTCEDDSRLLHIGEEFRVESSGPDLMQALSALATTLSDGIFQAPWQWHVPVSLEQLCFERWSSHVQDHVEANVVLPGRLPSRQAAGLEG